MPAWGIEAQRTHIKQVASECLMRIELRSTCALPWSAAGDGKSSRTALRIDSSLVGRASVTRTGQESGEKLNLTLYIYPVYIQTQSKQVKIMRATLVLAAAAFVPQSHSFDLSIQVRNALELNISVVNVRYFLV
jgi:hypothetical protein